MNDDHNRYRIATEHGLTYETIQKDFKSREHALNWIISNQLGRRNLNPNQIAYLRGKRYETEKKIWGGDRKSEEAKKSSGKNCHSMESSFKTAKKLADEYNVSERTIRYDESYSKAVDVLPEKIKDDVLSGDTLLRKTDAEIIVKMPKPTQKKFLKEVESGTPIKEAVKKL